MFVRRVVEPHLHTAFKMLAAAEPQRMAWWHWKPTSTQQAVEAEKKMLSIMNAPYGQQMVKIGDASINTLVAGSGPPIVLLHGLCAGLALWVKTIETLSATHTVYAIDWPGFGLSSRPKFDGKTTEEAEAFFIDRLEEWRKAVGLNRVTLLGHSMGGYLSAAYAMRFPDRVNHLILADPWGVPEKPKDMKMHFMWRLYSDNFSPLSVLRGLGPWGPRFLSRLRPDIAAKFAPMYEDPKLVMHYLYHCNAGVPTGEKAFATMSLNFGWCRNPLINRISELPKGLPISFVYGSHTWMSKENGKLIADRIGGRYAIVPNAGHQVFLDNHQAFNTIVKDLLRTSQ